MIKALLKNLLFISVFCHLNFCKQWKTEVSDQDIQKILNKLSYTRFFQRIEFEDLNAIQSDREIFLEICELNRLSPSLVLEKLKDTHPKLYKHLGNNYEK